MLIIMMIVVAIVVIIIIIYYFTTIHYGFAFQQKVLVLEGFQLSVPTKNHLYFSQKKRKKIIFPERINSSRLLNVHHILFFPDFSPVSALFPVADFH